LSIAKFDVDIQMSEKLLEKFVYTRLRIVECLGYTPTGHQCIVSEKGYHFWIRVREVLSDQELCDLQFLLGDDQPRCRFNYLRDDAGVFRVFNALFNKKLKRGHHGEL